MGIEVLAVSLPLPSSQWERLSSSHQASTRGVAEMGCLEFASSRAVKPVSLPARDNLLRTCSIQTCNHSAGGQTEGYFRQHYQKKFTAYKYIWGWATQPSPDWKHSFGRCFSASEALLTSQSHPGIFLVGNERIGVLLLNLGGPETLDDVQPFLFNLFADPDIIRLPRLFRFLQKPLAQFISIVRAPKSKEGYASIGGGSPLRQITDAQAEALRKALCDKNVPANVYVGMRYWHPFTEEAIEQIKRDGVTKLVVLPLYPQFSISTSGSSLRLLENIFREDEYLVNMQHTVIPSWYQREGYIKAMATLIEEELSKFAITQKSMAEWRPRFSHDDEAGPSQQSHDETVPSQQPHDIHPTHQRPSLLRYQARHRSELVRTGQDDIDLIVRHHRTLPFDERYRPYLTMAGLIGAVQVGFVTVDRALVHALVERWRQETHTFHLAVGEMTVTLQDVAIILGLPIDGVPVIGPTDIDADGLILDLLGRESDESTFRSGTSIRLSWLHREFHYLPADADELTVQRHCRAYILTLFGGVFFPDTQGDTVSSIYLMFLVDFYQAGHYSWGSTVLAYLYRSLCRASMRHRYFTGASHLLQLWSWERLHIGRPTMRAQAPAVDPFADPHDLPPLGHRWVGPLTYRRGPVRSLSYYRDELDMLRDRQVVWTPYTPEILETLPPRCTAHQGSWLTTAPLLHFWIVEMHCPDRVMRQFGLHQVVPPPSSSTGDHLHGVDRRGHTRENWLDTHREYIHQWMGRGERVVAEDMPYDPSTLAEYMEWYTGATYMRIQPHQDEAGPSIPPADLRYEPRAPPLASTIGHLTRMASRARQGLMTSPITQTARDAFRDILHSIRSVMCQHGEDVRAAAILRGPVAPSRPRGPPPRRRAPAHPVPIDLPPPPAGPPEDLPRSPPVHVDLPPRHPEPQRRRRRAARHPDPPPPFPMDLPPPPPAPVEHHADPSYDMPPQSQLTQEHGPEAGPSALQTYRRRRRLPDRYTP